MRTLCAAQRVRNSSLRVRELADEVGQVAVVGVAAGRGAQDGDGVVGGAFPVAVEVVRARVEEEEAGVVTGRAGSAYSSEYRPRASGLAARMSRRPLLHERGRAGDRVEHALHARAGSVAWSGAGGAGVVGCGRAGEVEEVRALGVVELERASERLQHALGDAAQVAALQAGVVVDADAGQDGDLLAAQAGNAASAVGVSPAWSGVIWPRGR